MSLFDDIMGSSLMMEASTETHMIRDAIYPQVEKTLSTPKGNREFREAVRKFIDKNHANLYTSGPVNMVAFTDMDKKAFFDIFDMDENEVKKVITEMTKTVNDKANWRLMRQNPIFCLFYECIRYYTLKKDTSGINTALAIYALSVYPSVFSVSFKYGANAQVMQYTVDNLTQKHLFKQMGNVFSTLMASIQNSYRFLQPGFADSPDSEIIRWTSRIRNDQKSLLRNIADEYYANFKKGLKVSTQSEVYGDNEQIQDNVNNTSVVEDVTRKITLSMVTNGVDFTRASAAAKIAGISVSDLRFYLDKIIIDDRRTELQEFIEAILFIFLYVEHHRPEEINETGFLKFSLELFRRTNTNDVNVVKIKDCLQKWSDDTGIVERFKRLASQINYKKGIFLYVILCIQYYNT